MKNIICAAVLFLLLFACKQQESTPISSPPENKSESAMVTAALELLASLSEDQKQQAMLTFEDDERSFWHFTPSPHRGLTWEKMNENQRKAMTKLLETGLSNKGMAKTKEIMALELVLREIEERGADDRYRHPELYYLMIFGNPGAEPWGWRFEGHHVSLNYTSVGDQLSVTPAFMGANPAEVPSGPEQGKRVLAKEEDLARELLASFNSDQLAQVIIADQAPEEIVTGMERKAMMEKQEGLSYGSMNDQQQQLLKKLVNNYLDDMAEPVAKEQLDRIEAESWENVYFAWAGETERGPGKAHYYRVHGPSLLIEYDNIQNNANHIHTVWRDLKNDFGEDLLKHHHDTKH
jgi:hypothetical protein